MATITIILLCAVALLLILQALNVPMSQKAFNIILLVILGLAIFFAG